MEQDTSTDRKLKYKILSRPACPTISIAEASVGSSRVPPSVYESDKDLRVKKKAKSMKTDSTLDFMAKSKLKYQEFSRLVSPTVSAEKSVVESFP